MIFLVINHEGSPEEGGSLVRPAQLCVKGKCNNLEALTAMCPMDSTTRLGNVQNGTNGLILWYSFLVGSVRNGNEKIKL